MRERWGELERGVDEARERYSIVEDVGVEGRRIKVKWGDSGTHQRGRRWCWRSRGPMWERRRCG